MAKRPHKKLKSGATPATIAPGDIQTHLMRWYAANHRRLPWRAKPGKKGNPYHVLVSEAMLQQTQVGTVLGYFTRFMERFPTLADLAAAEEKEVLRMWQGLGYYRRAKMLHAAAREIVNNLDGQVPRDLEILLQLPGVGRYTAGAIASIAHGKQAPVLDGNVMRVLARWYAIEAAVDHPQTQNLLWDLAEAILPRKHPGDFNQALMELGALVCVPAGPRCLICPMAELCQAHLHGLEGELPRRWKRKAPVAVEHHVVAVRWENKFLLERRPDKGLWAGMWQFPTMEDGAKEVGEVEVIRWVQRTLGLRPAGVKKLGDFKHQTTHRAIRFHVWEAVTGRNAGDDAAYAMEQVEDGTWRGLDELEDLPLPNPQRKVAGMLGKDFNTEGER